MLGNLKNRAPVKSGPKPTGRAKTIFRPIRFRADDSTAIDHYLEVTDQKFSPWAEGVLLEVAKRQA
jgi:hypothetical protein